jgi:tetratricopeptide (TPR) repeat protein
VFLSLLRNYLKLGVSALVVMCATMLPAQVYKIGGDSSDNTSQKQHPGDKKQKKQKQSPQKPNGQKSLGWGSNIKNARLGHAAEAALKTHNYAAALDYAQRAVDGAPGDPQLWFLLGYAARLAGKSQVSIDAYNKGLRLNPSSLDGLSGLAQTYRSMGNTAEAERILTQVTSADPKRANDIALLGEIYLNDRQYDRAISVLQDGEQVEPSARSELLISLSYQRQKQYDQANRYLEMAKKRAPNNPEVLRSMAGLYRETGNYEEAIKILKGIAGKKPDIMAELAYTYELAGKPIESAKLYAQAANAAPKKLDLQLSAAQAQVASGSTEKAEPFLQRAASLDGEHYRLHAIRGEIARLQDRDEDAVREYQTALAHVPPAPHEGPLYPIQLHVNLAQLAEHLQDKNTAQQQLEIARSSINSMDITGNRRPEFLRLRATIKMISGDFDGASNDVKEALSINDKDLATLQLNGDLLAKQGRPEEALVVYRKILATDHNSRSALTAAGYLSRETGHDQDAEKYFQRLATAYPNLYVPYVALGDLYTSRKDFARAQSSYRKAYDLSPKNSSIISGGMNAAIEAHTFPLAAEWLQRATPAMQHDPYVLRETERYYSLIKEYEKSAAIGQEAIKKLPKDRDVVVYLGYDLLRLEKYDELLALATQFEDVLPKEPDIPLFEGYGHKHAGNLAQAERDFTRSIERDPKTVTAYVNRGFVRNDTHRAAEASTDFETALKLETNNGEAHLGLAFASLSLHRPRVALKQAQIAEQIMGDSVSIHLIRATAYGEDGLLVKAVGEYHAALKFSPNDPNLHGALAEALYGLRRYREAITELQTADKLKPNDPLIYARLARPYAQLGDRNNTLHYVQLADQGNDSQIFVTSGEALDIIGEHDAAMQRFQRALDLPNSDTFAVRLVIAHHMTETGDWDGARRQVALGFMEARSGESLPPTPDELLHAGNVFLNIHDFQLAETYFKRALAAGGGETSARVGLANTYLAIGETAKARGEISSISNAADEEPSYQFLMAKANMYRQMHQNTQALTAFAQAAQAAGEDPNVERQLMQAGGAEGFRINHRVSFLSEFSVAPVFEDTTVYPLDAKLDIQNPLPGREGLLPLPRSSIETKWTGAYHLHINGMPDASGFFQVRNDRGQISLPSADRIVDRNTTDYAFNFAVNPTLHLGSDVLAFSTGIQEIVRRDSSDPLHMDQNLFRQFVYLNTSSFFNVIAVKGFAMHESGPFTLQDLHSRDLSAQLDFRVGAPWAKTALVTGYGVRDLQFNPTIREFYFTSAYAGIERRFTPNLTVRAVAEDVRAWRVDSGRFAIAQALRPAATVEYRPTRNWGVEGTFAYSRNMGFHAYDAVHSGFAVSYALPFQQSFNDSTGDLVVKYPIRFSAGVEQETFYNFTGGDNQQFRPYVRITIF